MGLIVISFFVTALLVFTIVFLLFRKFGHGNNPFRKSYFWIASIVLTPVIYFGSLFTWFSIAASYEAQEFDKNTWQKNEESRYVFVDDLVEGEKLIGLSRDELESMLGKADYEDDSTMTYYLGYSPGVYLNMDPDWLVSDLTDGKVSYVYIRE